MRMDVPYDLESFPNFFSGIFLEDGVRKDFLIFEEQNDLIPLVEYIRSDKCLVGYNSIHYDNVILNYLITYFNSLKTLTGYQLAANINKLSQAIINFDNEEKKIQQLIKKLRYSTSYQFIDLLEVIREGYNVKGLKAVGVNLKWHRIQDLPHHYTHAVLPEEVNDILHYNFNDVQITNLVLEYIQPRIKMREVLSAKYGINVLSDADSKIAKTTFDKFYEDVSRESIESVQHLRSKRTSLKIDELIFDWVKFKTPELNEYLSILKEVIISNIEQAKIKVNGKETDSVQFDIPELTFNGITYTLGLGGIHSVDKPAIFEATEDILLWDKDVGSQYPNCILNNEVFPEHLNSKVFLEVLKMVVDERMDNKAKGKFEEFCKILSNGLKISINTVYGLFNYKGYWLYDPRATYVVTLNNQMSILMLIEDLYLQGIEVISANTDGIIIRTSKNNKDLVNSICKTWEETTGFVLEDTFYIKYIRRDINNFITVKDNGKAKVKGIFIPQGGVLKGYDKPIVAIALRNYFTLDIPVEDTIRNIGTSYIFSNLAIEGEERVTDIYDYCMAKKVGSTYSRAELHLDDSKEEVQRSLRYYASNSGGELFKVKINEDLTESYQTLLSSSKVTLFNDYYDSEDYDINYQYYIDECNKVICLIEGKIFIDKDKLEEKISKIQERLDKNQAKYDNFIVKQSKSKAVETTKLMIDKLTIELEELIKLR